MGGDIRVEQQKKSAVMRIGYFIDSILAGGTDQTITLEQGDSKEELELIQKLNIFAKRNKALDEYTLGLAKGDLTLTPHVIIPSGLLELHSTLLHFIWKMNQISQGDLEQRIDGMGQFSAAFNDMVEQLRKRDRELAESRNVVEALWAYSSVIIFVTDAQTGEVIFGKREGAGAPADTSFLATSQNVIEMLNKRMRDVTESSAEWDLYVEAENKWYKVKTMTMSWTGDHHKVYFHMLFDISEHKAIQVKLESEIVKDPMTGIFNHAFGMETLDRLLRLKKRFTIAYFDLDGLKKTNDSMGHLVGDEMIKTFVNIVLGMIRSYDLFCRMGGDEFMLISDEGSAETVQNMVNRIEEKVNQFNAAEQRGFVLSFSYGLAEYDTLSNLSSQAVVDMADKKMYRQKNEKRKAISQLVK